jgi:hypothetical protein
VALVPTALPQESEHRRDFYRDDFRHREQMVRIRQEFLRRPTGPTARRESDRLKPSGEGMPDGQGRAQCHCYRHYARPNDPALLGS